MIARLLITSAEWVAVAARLGSGARRPMQMSCIDQVRKPKCRQLLLVRGQT